MIDDLRRIETRFEARALASPGALAMSSDQGRMTYGELLGLARRYALQIGGGGDGSPVVAILADRGPQVVIAALACAFAGRPFAILDLAYPRARLEALMDLCRPGLLLLAGRRAAAEAMAFDLPRLQILADARGDFVVDGPAPAKAAGSPDDPAYLLFTSGSTGAPKGVACSHRPLVNFVGWQERTFGLGADDCFTMLSGLSHDPVLRDIFTPLSLGASIHIPDQETLTAPGGLAGWFAAVQPTVAHMTPQLGHLLTAGSRGRRIETLRYVFWGGDMLRGAQVEALSALAPGCESVNFYGSTETPQAAAYHRVRPGAGDERAPIGVGIDGFELDILNDDGWSVDDGEAGEIVVRSRFLTLGYVAGGMLPAARDRDEIGAYATGDIGVRRGDGEVMIKGRRDDQVKVRGYRVELAEITAAALKVPGAAQAVTLNVGDRESVRIAAFVAPSEGAVLDAGFLRSRIAGVLPA